MHSLRYPLFRSVSLVLLGVAMTACSSGGGGAPPAQTSPLASSALSSAGASAASAQPSGGAVETVAAASFVPGGTGSAPSSGSGGSTGSGGPSGTGACSTSELSGFQKYNLDGFEADHFCGPATASITLGGTTVQIAGGSCTTNLAGYYVSIGTELFGSPTPAQQPDLLIILVDPTTGSGTINGVIDHKRWLLNRSPVSFGPGKHSGTFSGTTLVPGSAVHGSFTC